MNKGLVTFDFDGTLSQYPVQEYARELMDRGYTVGVVTARYDEMQKHRWPANPCNEDLWKIIHTLGINPHMVRFTCMEPKHTYLSHTGALWHLEDSVDEIEKIYRDRKCNTVPVYVLRKDWKEVCEDVIKRHENSTREALSRV